MYGTHSTPVSAVTSAKYKSSVFMVVSWLEGGARLAEVEFCEAWWLGLAAGARPEGGVSLRLAGGERPDAQGP